MDEEKFAWVLLECRLHSGDEAVRRLSQMPEVGHQAGNPGRSSCAAQDPVNDRYQATIA